MVLFDLIMPLRVGSAAVLAGFVAFCLVALHSVAGQRSSPTDEDTPNFEEDPQSLANSAILRK